MFERKVGDHEKQKQAYCQNVGLLDEFMTKKIVLESSNPAVDIYPVTLKRYVEYKRLLSLHLSEWGKLKLHYEPVAGMTNMATPVWR
jgi:hypothetical protein